MKSDTDLSRKCTVRDGRFIEPCEELYNNTEDRPPSGKQKGLFQWRYVDFTTGKPTRIFFGCKSGTNANNGFLFNFCPFCGTQIDAPFNCEVTQ